MKTYKTMLNEIAPLAVSPVTAIIGIGVAAGVVMAIKQVVSDTISSGIKFLVRNPVPVAVALIAYDQAMNQGKGRVALIKYFQRSCPGQARIFYDGLTDIVMTKEISPDKVADMAQKMWQEFDKMKD